MTEIFRLRRADLAFPSRAAKQGRGNESVSGGDREPRLTEPQRDSCRRSRRMRCSAAARLCRQMLHFASLTEILSLRYRLSVFLSRRKKNSEKERPLRGLRREVSPDLFRRTEIKLKPGAQCGSAPRAPPGNGCDRWRQRQRGCAQLKKLLYSGQKMFVCAPRGTISTLASP